MPHTCCDSRRARRLAAERDAAHHHRGEALRRSIRPGRHTTSSRSSSKTSRDFPPEAMAKICGIPAETLREVARLYARAEAAIIFWGMGISQHIHGTDNTRCLIALALIDGADRPSGHRPASAARPEQCAGRFRRGSHPDVLPRLQVGRRCRDARVLRKALEREARSEARA